MGGGVFIGVFWGAVVSVLVLAVVSLSTPLPDTRPGALSQDQGLASPAAMSELDGQRPMADGMATMPGAGQAPAAVELLETTDPVAPPAEMPQEMPPEVAAPAAAPSTPAAPSAPVPQTDAPATEQPSAEASGRVAGEAVDETVASETLDASGTAPASPQPLDRIDDVARPAAPDAAAPPVPALEDRAPVAQGAIAAAPSGLDATPSDPVVEVDRPAPAPQSPSQTASGAQDTAEAPPRILQQPQGQAPVGLAVEDEFDVARVDDDAAPLDLPNALPEAGAGTEDEGTAATEIAATPAPRLPQIGDDTRSDAAAMAGQGDQVTPTTEAAPMDAALRRYAAPFDAAETRPLMAVILIDDPDTRLELGTLTRFSFPVAFAIDPLRPDAAERAASFRAAGFEVLILGTAIPEGATPTDTEVALEGAMRLMPEAIGVLDTPDSRIQADRPVLDAVVSVMADRGQGLVAFQRGLNAAEQSASRADVPAATLFRQLDDEDQRATVITRLLSRAEFAAVQEGTVVVVGLTRPDTVTALFSWALGGRNEVVAIAPLSAVLLRGAGQL